MICGVSLITKASCKANSSNHVWSEFKHEDRVQFLNVMEQFDLICVASSSAEKKQEKEPWEYMESSVSYVNTDTSQEILRAVTVQTWEYQTGIRFREMGITEIFSWTSMVYSQVRNDVSLITFWTFKYWYLVIIYTLHTSTIHFTMYYIFTTSQTT